MADGAAWAVVFVDVDVGFVRASVGFGEAGWVFCWFAVGCGVCDFDEAEWAGVFGFFVVFGELVWVGLDVSYEYWEALFFNDGEYVFSVDC